MFGDVSVMCGWVCCAECHMRVYTCMRMCMYLEKIQLVGIQLTVVQVYMYNIGYTMQHW